jgi:hypothetical protein
MKTQNFQSLENASKRKATLPLEGERRKFPRLAISREAFRLKPHGKLFSISDISPSGFCLRVNDEQDLLGFPIGGTFHGELGFRGERIRVEARVMRVERGFVGAEITQMAALDQALLAERLSPAVLGRELRLIPGGDLEQIWYHALNGADWNLQMESQVSSVRGFLVRLHGVYAQWRRDAQGEEFLVTGTVGHSLPGGFDSGAIRMETWALHPDSEPDSEKLRIAILLLSGCNEKTELRDFCLAQLRPQ